jgi:hypothetical protein
MVFVEKATPVSESDFLAQDPAVPGQNYACLSYVSPEATLDAKDAFLADKFRKQVMSDLALLLQKLDTEFPEEDGGYLIDRIKTRHFAEDGDLLLKERRTERVDVGWTTGVRGLKVRGVYETLDDAQARATQLKKVDKEYDVFVAEVGCWCPWHPDPSQIGEKQYSNPQENAIFKARSSHPDIFE